VLASELSAYDILRSDWVVFTDRTLPGAQSADTAEPVESGDEVGSDQTAIEVNDVNDVNDEEADPDA
jgi:hypothetical protein